MFVLGTVGRDIWDAFELEPDEHFEVTKAWLWSQGIPLYEKISNDQPPGFTLILGTAFRVFGSHI